MIRVISISREYGSGGAVIAGIIAERLGWRLVDNSLLLEIARTAKINPALAQRYDECVDPWFHRLAKAMWHGGYEGVSTTVENNFFDADTMVSLCRSIIEEAAEIGNCVMVGRGSVCLLQRRDDVFPAFVYAPLEQKIRRLRERMGGEHADLVTLAEETDRMRGAYIRRYFGQDWTDRHLYALMVCSSIGLEAAADAILCAAGLAGRRT